MAKARGGSRVAGLRRPHSAGAEEEMKGRGRIEEGSAREGQCANMLSSLDPTWRFTEAVNAGQRRFGPQLTHLNRSWT